MRTCGMLLALCFMSAAGAQAPKAVPLTTFTDGSTGITLEYPSAWKLADGPADYCGSIAFNGEKGDPAPAFSVRLSSEGTYYEKTTLKSMWFTFGSTNKLSEMSCRAVARDIPEPDSPPTIITINGITYNHASGGECGLNNVILADVYTTFRNSTCYVFETDFYKFGGPVEDDQHNLTKGEFATLRRHLQRIMHSVRFGPVKTVANAKSSQNSKGNKESGKN